MLADSISGETSLPGLQMAAFSRVLAWPFFVHASEETETETATERAVWSLLLSGYYPVGSGSHPSDLF